MIRGKRIGLMIVLVLFMASLLSVTVFANGPVPADWYDVFLTNLPEGTAYVDLLIPLAESDPVYVALEEKNLTGAITEHSEIVTYCEDGFRSYTFHYQDALSVIAVRDNSSVSFFMDDSQGDQMTGYRFGHLEDIEERCVIRLAMLDEHGNILKVSPELAVKSRNVFAFFAGNCYYDAAADTWKMDMESSGSGIFFYLIVSEIGIGFTMLIERLAAVPFKLGKSYGALILQTNLVSQLVMRCGYLLLYGLIFWRYAQAMIVLEILVYLGEYLFYRYKIKGVSGLKILLYTISANTASLVLCYYINKMLIYH